MHVMAIRAPRRTFMVGIVVRLMIAMLAKDRHLDHVSNEMSGAGNLEQRDGCQQMEGKKYETSRTAHWLRSSSCSYVVPAGNHEITS
jgi:hypothetical protein